jgi:hypothetical protein
MTYLLFATALGLSACAAYYSVMGLVAIFASAVIPIFIMGSLLEASKLVVASWLYRNWKEVPVLLKSYFTVALIILMMLTSMGIFGYLSKAHLDQAIPTGDVAAKLALIDEKIKTEKENINASRKELSQLDSQVDQTISRTTDANGTDRAIAIRRGQQKDRARILNEIGQAQAKVAKYNEERAPIASEVRKVEAEVGPIKYIAALIYGDNPETDVLEKAVRWVIILIVSVFDPLAVLLLIAANWQMRQEKTKVLPVEDDTVVEEEPEPEPIKISLEDEVPVWEEANIKSNHEEEVPEVQTDSEEGDLDIQVEEHNKEWEPLLYNRRELGRHLEEITPVKTKSFLQKVADTFRAPEVKSIEKEVEELQDKNTK